MNLLNFKFFKKAKKSSEKDPTRQERKEMAKVAKAHRLSRKMRGHSLEPLMGSATAYVASNTRQGRRLRLRQDAFDEITKKYPGELRKVRRSMAFALAKRLYRKANART